MGCCVLIVINLKLTRDLLRFRHSFRVSLVIIVIIGLFVFARFVIIVPVGIFLGIILIRIPRRQNLQQIETRAFLLGCFDCPHKGFDNPAIVSASPGVISPRASPEVTASIARETSWADGPLVSPVRPPSIGGRLNLMVRSRHGGSTRSIQSRIAVGSPASAISTALRVNASASPASSVAAASVVLLREPRRRPPGLPDRPFSNGRPRTRPGGFRESRSLIVISVVQPQARAPGGAIGKA